VIATFAEPVRFWLLLGLLPLAGLYLWSIRRRHQRAVRFTNLDLLASIAPKSPGWRRHVVAGLTLLALAIGIIASAQPYRTERVAGERSIIMLALDVSLSMEADDVEPSRFEAAKSAAKEFVAQVDPSIDVGLVSFSLDVRTRVQPTLDRDKVENAIDRLRLGPGTNIGGAIEGATNTITDSFDTGDDGRPTTADGEYPAAVVVLTDGETVEGGTTGQVGAIVAKEAGIPVYGIVFGTPDGVVVLEDPETGDTVEQPVPVKYEELTQAAALTGGKFYKAESEGALRDAYGDITDNLGEALKVPEPQRVDVTWLYLLFALALFASAFALGLWWLGGLV